MAQVTKSISLICLLCDGGGGRSKTGKHITGYVNNSNIKLLSYACATLKIIAHTSPPSRGIKHTCKSGKATKRM